MADDTRKKDASWSIYPQLGGSYSHDAAGVAILMDIRDELKALNQLLNCRNFIGIPATLRTIARNTAKPRKRKA